MLEGIGRGLEALFGYISGFKIDKKDKGNENRTKKSKANPKEETKIEELETKKDDCSQIRIRVEKKDKKDENKAIVGEEVSKNRIGDEKGGLEK
ncbi:29967_t:CDS:2 [Gigaspora margarita]|uniref:29967_t:CDS:1 n=1 Tax=Gigaspora margarita TaxID=4874 RepID=A0ABN7U8M6_GIGMA|nr:29967_t:CDS:2 [Gigaspora margarita]